MVGHAGYGFLSLLLNPVCLAVVEVTILSFSSNAGKVSYWHPIGTISLGPVQVLSLAEVADCRLNQMNK